jgi:hypothetical protein
MIDDRNIDFYDAVFKIGMAEKNLELIENKMVVPFAKFIKQC